MIFVRNKKKIRELNIKFVKYKNVLMKKCFYFVFLSFLLALNSCSDESVTNTPKDGNIADSISIIYQSQGGCTYIVEIGKDYKCKETWCYTTKVSEEKLTITKIKKDTLFIIKDFNTIHNIQSFISILKNSKNSFKGEIQDASRRRIYVNGIKKIDVYGTSNGVADKFNELLEILSSELPIKVDYSCWS